MNKFNYISSEFEIKKESDSKFVIVRENISNKRELLDLFSKDLFFPFYFGENWDALYDCLVDLSWVKENKIYIIHKDIPLEEIKHEQIKYIEILSDVLDSWECGGIHSVNVYFQNKSKEEIERLLSK